MGREFFGIIDQDLTKEETESDTLKILLGKL